MENGENSSDSDEIAEGQWENLEVTPQGTESDTSDGDTTGESPVRPNPPPLTLKKIPKNKPFREMRQGKLQPKKLMFGSPQRKKKQEDCNMVSKREKLLNLQEKRIASSEGTWVQCCNSECKKWRHLKDIQEPCLLPIKWQCTMNKDIEHNSCDKPEEDYSHLEFFYLKHTAGCLVWAKISGFPWWPAMVDDDPDNRQFFWTNGFSEIPTHYHVVFLDFNVTRAWISSSCLRSFTENPLPQDTKSLRKDLKFKLAEAIRRAQAALSLSIPERLKKFSFANTFRGQWPKTPESSSESEPSLECQSPKRKIDDNTCKTSQEKRHKGGKTGNLITIESSSEEEEGDPAHNSDVLFSGTCSADLGIQKTDTSTGSTSGHKQPKKNNQTLVKQNSRCVVKDSGILFSDKTSNADFTNQGVQLMSAEDDLSHLETQKRENTERKYENNISSGNSNTGGERMPGSNNNVNSKVVPFMSSNTINKGRKDTKHITTDLTNVELTIDSVIKTMSENVDTQKTAVSKSADENQGKVNIKKQNTEKSQVKGKTLKTSLQNKQDNAKIKKTSTVKTPDTSASKSTDLRKEIKSHSTLPRDSKVSNKGNEKVKPVFSVKRKSASVTGSIPENSAEVSSTLEVKNEVSQQKNNERQSQEGSLLIKDSMKTASRLNNHNKYGDTFREGKINSEMESQSQDEKKKSKFGFKTASQLTTDSKHETRLTQDSSKTASQLTNEGMGDEVMLTQDDPSDFEELSQLVHKLSPPSSQRSILFETEE